MPETLTIKASPAPDQTIYGESTAILMNPLNAAMTPLSQSVVREQKIDLSDLKDLMQETLTALQRSQEDAVQLDLGAEETRPVDLRARFAPRMAQENRLYTGRGDERTIIV
ncbi:MAG: hypothetical protein P8010_05675 [Desulfosarcinaceae bacterium]|jgi:hypothetical protein